MPDVYTGQARNAKTNEEDCEVINIDAGEGRTLTINAIKGHLVRNSLIVIIETVDNY